MRRFLPQTLFGQTLLLLLGGIGLALLAGTWIYGGARQEAVRAVGALVAAERIINVSLLIAEAPPEWRRRLVEGASDASFKVALASEPPLARSGEGDSAASKAIAALIRESLPARAVNVSVAQDATAWENRAAWRRGPGRHEMGGGGGMRMGLGPRGDGMHGPLAHAAMAWRGLNAAVQLEDGQWLTFATALPDAGPAPSMNLLLALGVAAALIALLTAWAVRRMTAPLAVLSKAAVRLGQDVDAPPLAASGSIEVRRATEAFNGMQARLRQLLSNRTLMLAAISHDMRTQLTLLRLRTEAMQGEDCERMLKTISEMEEMLTASLSFARDESRTEGRRQVDLGALVASIVDDMADAGLPVTLGFVADGAIAECKPAALRRAIVNLIDNAIKYGTKARVSLDVGHPGVIVTVDDEGPGIAPEELVSVIQPFYRVESSRNRDTGGIGLGLAIATSIVDAHGGTLSLSNRSGGGLSARIMLPRVAPPSGDSQVGVPRASKSIH